LLGGWLWDKLGRRVMFLTTMAMFVVLVRAFVPRVTWLIAIRFEQD
jgi:MFS family permease